MQRSTKHRLILSAIGAVMLVVLSFPLCDFTSRRTIDVTVADQGAAAEIFDGQLCNGADCVRALLFRGGVTKQSVQRLAQALLDTKDVKWVCLESPGGEADAANDLARAFHNSEVGTCVVPRKVAGESLEPVMCGSACSAMWLGGHQRILADGGGIVGFHAAYAGDSWCCVLVNEVKLAQAWFASWRAGRALGDADARSVLFAKGKNCGKHEFYRLNAHEALQLGLLSAEHAKPGWHWRPTNPAAVFTPQPKGTDCSARV